LVTKRQNFYEKDVYFCGERFGVKFVHLFDVCRANFTDTSGKTVRQLSPTSSRSSMSTSKIGSVRQISFSTSSGFVRTVSNLSISIRSGAQPIRFFSLGRSLKSWTQRFRIFNLGYFLFIKGVTVVLKLYNFAAYSYTCFPWPTRTFVILYGPCLGELELPVIKLFIVNYAKLKLFWRSFKLPF